MAINSDVGPYLSTYSTTDLQNAVTRLTDWGFSVVNGSDNGKGWIKSHWSVTKQKGTQTKSVGQVVSGLDSPSPNPDNYGIFSQSNLGDTDDILAGLRNLDSILSGMGTTPAAPAPAPLQTGAAQQVIPAGAGATIVINIYPGGAAAVASGMPVTSPQAAVPGTGYNLPATAGPTQSIDAAASKRANDLQMLKAVKEKIAAKLQQVENLQNEIQLKARQESEARKKEEEKKK
jgi:hypothetical protein